jgi:hypothetical protein
VQELTHGHGLMLDDVEGRWREAYEKERERARAAEMMTEAAQRDRCLRALFFSSNCLTCTILAVDDEVCAFCRESDIETLHEMRGQVEKVRFDGALFAAFTTQTPRH